MTDEERKIALYCLKVSSDYHSEVCQECIKFHNCDHVGKDDVTETIIKALEQEVCGDAVSRQDVDQNIYDYAESNGLSYANMKNAILDLPSVTPTRCIATVQFSKDDLQEIVDEKVKEFTLVQNWIPCSERLPEDYEIVIASVHGDVYPESRYSKEDGWEYAYESGADYWEELDDVVAWMPMPKPYEVKNDDEERSS